MLALDTPCTAFEGHRRIAAGSLNDVALVAKRALDASARQDQPLPVLVLVDSSSEVLELDWRGSEQAFTHRLREQAGSSAPQAMQSGTGAATNAANDAGATGRDAPPEEAASRGPGRPRLGVVAREVTLLPRHWEWLATQPGGASVALRKLVENAKREHEVRDRLKQATNTAYKFMSVIAGNLPGFEEASRALFAKDHPRFRQLIADWPADLRAHLAALAEPAFTDRREQAAS